MILQCIVVDDEYPARLILEDFIRRTPNVQLIESFSDPVKAFQFLQHIKVDLLFLDIQMPQLSGLALLKSLENAPKVIFTTAYDSYALDGFNLDVTDYLLKPFSYTRFEKGINKVFSALKADISPEESQAYHIFKADRRVYRLAYEDISYIEGMREYVRIHTIDSEKYMQLISLKTLEDTLPGKQFIRVHKSFIVNIKFVKYLHGNFLVVESKQIPVGKSYKEKVTQLLFK